jgi:hypothetical protein
VIHFGDFQSYRNSFELWSTCHPVETVRDSLSKKRENRVCNFTERDSTPME